MGKKNAVSKDELSALKAFLLDIDCLDRLSNWTNKFNVFDVLKISRAEIRHSNVLAWMMNPNENHGLGDSVLRGFIQYVVTSFPDNSDVFSTLLMDCYNFSIYREWHNIDILAVSENEHFLLCIENKIDTGEHDDQLNRYRNLVEKDYPDYKKMYVYLSPEGDTSSDPTRWCSMSYKDVLNIIESACNRKKPMPEATLLIENYIDTIRRDIVGDEELSRICAEIYAKHQKALDLIFENRPNISSMVNETIQRWLEEKNANGQIQYRSENNTKKTYRFKTNAMSEILPDANGSLSSWNTANFYFYELRNRDSKEIFISFTIDTKEIPYDLKQQCDRICESYCPLQMKPGKQYRTPFESQHYSLDDEFSEGKIVEILNRCLNELQNFEIELKKVLNEQ